jgi:amidohydrolase
MIARQAIALLVLGFALAPALAPDDSRAAPASPSPAGAAVVDAKPLWPALEPLYRDLHSHPELSFQETATAARLADRLKALGFDVATGVGKTGVVGVLRNGPGETVMLRTDMDALPVEEKTGLPFASRATATDTTGRTVPVMHACGHDVHMTAWMGAATWLAGNRKSWSGTLLLVGQPAEESGGGARAMLDDGLFTRFPRPGAALAIHDMEVLPAGTIGIKAGPVMASADSVDLVVYGKGGHGARPSTTVDPIVIAAKIVVGIQTLISRENDPFDPAVVTVGSFHAGTKHNIIPDEARLQLTVRAFRTEVRERLLKGIERIAKAEAEAANAPRPPEVRVLESIGPTVNDARLAGRVEAALRRGLGDARVRPGVTLMAAEDFSQYAEAGVPILMLSLGAANREAFERAQREGTALPGLHSPLFAPDPEPTITTGVEALVTAALDLFGARQGAPDR